MSTPTQPEVLWRCLNIEADDPDEHGDMALHFTLQHQSGFTFVVSATGPARARGKLFVDALRAAAATIALSLGGTAQGARLLPPHTTH